MMAALTFDDKYNLVSKYDIEKAVVDVCDNLYANKNKSIITWRNCSEEDLWAEMVACILGSRVSYELARSCISHLLSTNHLDYTQIIGDPIGSEQKIANELSKSMFSNGNKSRRSKYPFSYSRAHYIVETAIGIYRTTTIKHILSHSISEKEARETISNTCLGIGYKQASLFLRNVGFSRNLAILDVHVLKYMALMDLVEDKNIRTVSRKQEYSKIEKILNDYAVSMNMPVPKMDLAIWVVMRLVSREGCICQ